MSFRLAKICSFCETRKLQFVASNEGEDADLICLECVYHASVQVGKFPLGAVACFSCQDYSRFVVRYNGSSMIFEENGVDQKGRLIYSPISSTGEWRLNSPPKKAFCAFCSGDIPLWMLGAAVPYVRR